MANANPNRHESQGKTITRLDVLAEVASHQKRLPVLDKGRDNLNLLSKAATKMLNQDKSSKGVDDKTNKRVHDIKSDTGNTETIYPGDLPDDDDATIVEFPMDSK
jgi:hypothetical protein